MTRYRYETEIRENVMEVRKRPVSRPDQRCLSFDIKVSPHANLFDFQEQNGNTVHHFDITQPHHEMIVTAESLVEVKIPREEDTNDEVKWEELEPLKEDFQFLEYLLPSPLIPKSEALVQFHKDAIAQEARTPYSFLKNLNHHIASTFDYVPLSTQVDSPIEECLVSKQGVCQDFAHIMVGVARLAGIPARYISGYLFHRKDLQDRSSEDASHAWVEAYLPGKGWIGFDPTNDILTTDRHIVTCTGRDYKDVPPTRGVYRGECASELSVAVQVHHADDPHLDDDFRRMMESDLQPENWAGRAAEQEAQQQQ